MSSSLVEFTVTSNLNTKDFSWVFLVDWLMVICLTLFILFYVSQLSGWVISKIAGYFFWRWYNVVVQVGSIQLSVLGGRLIFRDFKYIGANEAVSVVHGTLTWRYWQRRTRLAALFSSEEEPKHKDECAMKLELHGLEWFIYNRSPVYDMIRDQTNGVETQVPYFERRLSSMETRLLRMLPVELKVDDSAVIMGNIHTKSLWTARARSIQALLDIAKPGSPKDRYRVSIVLDMKAPTVNLIPNIDYRDPAAADFPLDPLEHKEDDSSGHSWRFWSKQKELKHRKSWYETSRAAYEAAQDEQLIDKSEYAQVSTVAEADHATVEYFYDVAGPKTDTDSLNDAPDFGITALLTATEINYGPWTDRQRIQLMDTFFPRTCIDSKPVSYVFEPRKMRECPRLRVSVDFLDSVVIRVPTREPSKDFAWSKIHDQFFSGLSARTYGWAEISALEGSSLVAAVDLLPGKDGFTTVSRMVLKQPELRTSVNHDIAFRADSHIITTTQKVPLKWNGLQDWSLEHRSENLSMFILREQVTLVTDLFQDFGTGDAIQYSLFVPSVYTINWTASNFRMYVNVNSENIINNPTSLLENTFLVFGAGEVSFAVEFQAVQVAPVTTTSHISLRAKQLDLEIRAPPWHALDSFLDLPKVGRAHDFTLDVNYTYHADPSANKVEQEVMKVNAQDVTLIAHGFVIDYLMMVSDNYFGDKYHFQTTEEYLGKEHKDAEFDFQRGNLDIDVTVLADIKNGCIVLPGYLYSARDCLALRLSDFFADLRVNNYYMDMQLEFSPITAVAHYGLSADQLIELALCDSEALGAAPFAKVDELIVRTHRMFGLPPSEPTYMCKWDIAVGNISVDSQFKVVDLLGRVGKFFAHSFSGGENKPIVVLPELHDVTFVTVSLKSISAILWAAEDAYVDLRTSTMNIRVNDYANERFSGKVVFVVPLIEIRAQAAGTPALFLSTSIACTNFMKHKNAEAFRRAQQEHIALHDSLFRRCPFLLDSEHRFSNVYMNPPEDHLEPVMAMPSMPSQLTQEAILVVHPQTGAFDLERVQMTPSSGSLRSQYEGSSKQESNLGISDQESVARPHGVRNARGSHQSLGSFDHTFEYPNAERQNDFVHHKVQGMETDFGLESTAWHAHAPYLEGKDSIEYDDYVLEFGPVIGVLLPQVIPLADAIIATLSEVSLEATLDKLHCDIVSVLSQKSEKATARFHTVLSKVELRLGLPKLGSAMPEFGSQHAESSDLLLEPSHFLIGLQDAAIMVQTEGTASEIATDLSVSRVFMNIHKSHDSMVTAAVSFETRSIHFWLGKLDEAVARLQVGNIDLFWAEEDVCWVADYFGEVLEELAKLQEATLFKAASDRTKYAVYELTRSSVRNKIEQDSYVLSRPFGTVQTTEHVRSHMSWRVSVRLRHLLNHIPVEEVKEMERVLSTRDYCIPEDAKKTVMEVFRNWRSWEQIEDINSAIIFSNVFGDDGEPNYGPPIRIEALTDGLVARIGYADLTEDYFVLDYLNSKGYMKAGSTTIFGLVLACTSIRTHLSHRLIKVATNVLEKTRLITSRINARKPAQRCPSEQTKRDAYLNGTVSLFVQDFGVEVKLNSFSLEMQNHHVQTVSTFITTPGNWYHSTVAAMANSGLRVFKIGEDDIIDYLVESMSLGVVAVPDYTRVSIDLKSLSLTTLASFLELSKLASQLCDTDLKQFENLMQQLNFGAGSSGTGSPAASSNGMAAKPFFFVNLAVDRVKVKLNMLEDMQALLTGDNVTMRYRDQDGSSILMDFTIGRGILTVLYGAKKHVANASIEQLSTLLRLDTVNGQALDVNVNLNTITVDTMELLLFLDIVSEKGLLDEAEKLFASIAPVSNSQNAIPEDKEMSLAPEKEPMLVRCQGQVSEIRLSLLLHESTFTVVLRDLIIHYRDFTRNANGWPVLSPPSMGCSSGEIRLEFSKSLSKKDSWSPTSPPGALASQLRPPIFAIQLTASYDSQKDDRRIQVSSDYCKVILDPEVVGSMSQAFMKLDRRRRFFDNVDTSETVPETSKKPALETFDKLKSVLSFKNQSISWQTSAGGIAIGCDAIKIRQTGLTAKMEVESCYLRPTEKAFGRTGAKIPFVQLTAVALPDGDDYFVYLDNVGESLQIELTTTVAVLAASAMESVEDTRRIIMNGITEQANSSSHTIDTRSSPIRLPFSFSGKSSISSASIFFYDEYSRDLAPAVELHTPSAKIVSMYRRFDAPKVDLFQLDVDIADSENILYPKALQEMRNVFKRFQIAVQEQKFFTVSQPRKRRLSLANQPPQFRQPKPKPKVKSAKTEAQGPNVDHILSRIELNVTLHLSSQKFTLSCEPFAKIATTLFYKQADLTITSPRQNGESYFALSGRLSGAEVTLQHIFSNERSIYAGIDLITGTLVHKRGKIVAPLELGIFACTPVFDLKLTKIGDIQSFLDIWCPRAPEVVSPSSKSDEDSGDSDSPGIAYQKAMASLSLPWSLNLSVRHVLGTINLGPSVGMAKVDIDNLWLGLFKKSNTKQHYAFGLNGVNLSCEGRVGGKLVLSGISSHLTIEYPGEAEAPQMFILARIPSIEAYVSLDFNPFLAFSVRKTSLVMRNNQRPLEDYDELLISYECADARVALTALVASHLFDMANMISSFKRSTVRPAMTEAAAIRKKVMAQHRLELLARLKVDLHFALKHTELYVFPTDFSDPVAVSVTSQGASAEFGHWTSKEGVGGDLSMGISKLNLAVATMRKDSSGRDVTSLRVDEFFQSTAKFSRANIITIPECRIDMWATLQPWTETVHYTFKSAFNGTVMIGWNLGSVSFIREISNAHQQAWNVRKDIHMALREGQFQARKEEEELVASFDFPEPLLDFEEGSTRHHDLRTALEFVQAMKDSDFRFGKMPKYVPLKPPEISIPQLHDMGEATPPVEWLGLDRQKLPWAVHWYLVRPLYGITLDVERAYSHLLDRM